MSKLKFEVGDTVAFTTDGESWAVGIFEGDDIEGRRILTTKVEWIDAEFSQRIKAEDVLIVGITPDCMDCDGSKIEGEDKDMILECLIEDRCGHCQEKSDSRDNPNA